MKILHVVATSRRRGAEVFAADLVAALSDLGVDQEVAVLRDGLPHSVDFRVPTVRLRGESSVVPGIQIAPRAVRELHRAVARVRPRVIQLHGGEPLKYAIAAGIDRRVPVIYRRIGDHRQLRGGAPRTLVYGWLMRRAARVVAVADAVRRELVERFRVPPSRVLTIPNAVDLRRLEGLASKDEARDLLGLPREARVILSLGALTWEKDPLGHLAVAELVLAEHPDAFHLVVGDGPLRGRVAEAVRTGRFADRARLLPAQPDVRLPLAAADVLLMASRTEGMPAAVIEAGASGVPVAAYRLSGIPEVVVDGQTGLLAPPGDRVGLAARVLALLADEALRERLGAAARERCRSSFDIRVVAPRYLEVYQRLTV